MIKPFQRIGLIVSLCVYAFSAYSMQIVPELIDLTLTGSKNGATFEPSHIELEEDQTYLLVIHNPFDVPYEFVSQDLRDAIKTQYIQGSPGITQHSVTLSPNSKVQWVFYAKKPGDYAFYATSYGIQKTKTKPGKIHIDSIVPTHNAASQQNKSVKQEIQAPTEKEKFKRRKPGLKRY